VDFRKQPSRQADDGKTTVCQKGQQPIKRTMITELQLAKALKDVLPYVVVSVNDCDNHHCGYPCCVSCCGPENAQADASEAGQANSRACKVLEAWENNMPIVGKCQCDPGDFARREIPPICPEYFGDDEFCGVCWHDKECHQLKSEAVK
jgi:hypothetical protein